MLPSRPLTSTCMSVSRAVTVKSSSPLLALSRPLLAGVKTSAGDLRKGMIFREGGSYCEVQDFNISKKARGAVAYIIEYYDLVNGKRGSQKYMGGSSVTVHQLRKEERQVLYVDRENSNVIVADEEYNEEMIPLSLVPGGFVKGLEEVSEVKLTISRDEDGELVKIGYPASITKNYKRE